MANRIMLNETSYHGAGAIEEIANEAKAHDFKKAFVCSDPDLIKFGVTKKVRHSKNPVQIILSQLAEGLPWILPKQSELSLQIRSLKM